MDSLSLRTAGQSEDVRDRRERHNRKSIGKSSKISGNFSSIHLKVGAVSQRVGNRFRWSSRTFSRSKWIIFLQTFSLCMIAFDSLISRLSTSSSSSSPSSSSPAARAAAAAASKDESTGEDPFVDSKENFFRHRAERRPILSHIFDMTKMHRCLNESILFFSSLFSCHKLFVFLICTHTHTHAHAQDESTRSSLDSSPLVFWSFF